MCHIPSPMHLKLIKNQKLVYKNNNEFNEQQTFNTFLSTYFNIKFLIHNSTFLNILHPK